MLLMRAFYWVPEYSHLLNLVVDMLIFHGRSKGNKQPFVLSPSPVS